MAVGNEKDKKIIIKKLIKKLKKLKLKKLKINIKK